MPAPQHEPSRWIGAFLVLRQLGAGGMGEVHLCRTPGGQLLAVKTIHPHLAEDPVFRARFTREVNLARKVSGAYTAPVVDADTAAEMPWLATGYVPGPTLREAVVAAGPLPPDTLAVLAAGLVEALASVHAAGLTHRDLKPGNILLSSSGPRIIDFGIARAAEGTAVTRTGQVLGTPGFMAPEQAQGAESTPASDVFALGAVLGYAATGVEPFAGDSPASVVYRLLHEEPELSAAPAELHPLLVRCLAKDPAQRPDLAALRDHFAALTSGAPPRERAPEGGPAPEAEIAVLPQAVAEHVRGREAEARSLLEASPYTPPPPASHRRPGRLVGAIAGGAAVVLGAALALAFLLPGDSEPSAGPEAAEPAAEEAEPAHAALDEPAAEPAEPMGEADLPTFEPLSAHQHPHLETTYHLEFAAGGEVAVVLDADHLVAFEIPSGDLAYRVDRESSGGWHGMAVSPDREVVALSEGDRVRLLDARTGEEAGELPGTGDSRVAPTIAYTPDGELLVQVSREIDVWSPQSGARVDTLHEVGYFRDGNMVVSSEGSLVAFTGSEGIEMWSAEGERLGTAPVESTFHCCRLAFQPDSALLISHDARTMHLWNAISAEHLAEIEVGEHTAPSNGFAVHPNGHFLLASGQEDTLLVDLQARESLGEAALPRPTGGVPTDRETVNLPRATAFSPDGQYLAAAGRAGLFLWEVS